MTKSQKYWQERREQRLVSSEQIGNVGISKTLGIYEQSLRNVNAEIQSVYENYTKQVGNTTVLDVDALKKALNPLERAKFLKSIQKNAKILGINPKNVYDERYLYRLSRLEALKTQIQLEVMAIAPQEELISNQVYRNIIQNNYTESQLDLAGQGISPSFTTLDTKTLNTILNSKWKGSHYSARIWNNVGNLSQELPTLLGSALISGQDYQKTARDLRKRYEVKKWEAERLVRTETAYFHNQSELQSYLDDGIEEYTLDVTLDGRTSNICRAVNEGTIYKVRDAIVGVNFPPLHPNCRTVPRVVLATDRKKPTQAQRIERFSAVKDKDVMENWKKAMQGQMNPNKIAGHDYNADMNRLTQTLKGEELKLALNDLMNEIPKDYALRPALKRVAEMYGWRPALDANQLKVLDQLKQSGIGEDVVIKPEQAKFILDNNVKFQNVRGGIDDLAGVYNNENKTVSIDVVNTRDIAKNINRPGFYNAVVQHELGHAFDDIAVSKIIKDKQLTGLGGVSSKKDWYSISKYRLANGMADPETKAFFENLTPEAYSSMHESGETVKLGDKVIKAPRDIINYHLEPSELFAEAYSIFYTNPGWLQKNLPKVYDYYYKLTQ